MERGKSGTRNCGFHVRKALQRERIHYTPFRENIFHCGCNINNIKIVCWGSIAFFLNLRGEMPPLFSGGGQCIIQADFSVSILEAASLERAGALTRLRGHQGSPKERASERRGAGMCAGRDPWLQVWGLGRRLLWGPPLLFHSLQGTASISRLVRKDKTPLPQLPLGHLMSPKAPGWLALSPSTPFQSEPQAASRGSRHCLSFPEFSFNIFRRVLLESLQPQREKCGYSRLKKLLAFEER